MGARPEVTTPPMFITMLSTRFSVPIKTERLALQKQRIWNSRIKRKAAETTIVTSSPLGFSDLQSGVKVSFSHYPDLLYRLFRNRVLARPGRDAKASK